MKIYKVLSNNINYYINKLDESSEFKEQYPNTKAIDWLSYNTDMSKKRIQDILDLKIKPKIHEVGRIADALGIDIVKLFKEE